MYNAGRKEECTAPVRVTCVTKTVHSFLASYSSRARTSYITRDLLYFCRTYQRALCRHGMHGMNQMNENAFGKGSLHE